jgi:serine/threonine protein kinase
VVLIMEYAQGGELKQYLNEKGKLDEWEVREYIGQIISGLMQCHSKGIIHRDLKLENVLFTNAERK